MPKPRQTCTRCSMRRQKCDRGSPCSRCVQNNEAHLCTTEWTNGYNPAVHRKYLKKNLSTTPQKSTTSSSGLSLPVRSQTPNGQLGLDPTHELSISSRSDTQSQSQLTTDSTNVDFITYGRSDYSDISMATLLKEKDEFVQNQALLNQNSNKSNTDASLDEPISESLSPAAQSVEVHHLRTLLPPKDQVFRMVDYHDRCMSYWVGGIYHAPSFRKCLLKAYGESQELDLRAHDWRWSALLFSILSSSMIGSPEAVSSAWGFSDKEKVKRSKQWSKAMMSSLHLGDYASRHHIYSVQAILNMHTSEHLTGSTKQWAAYQAAATVIARGLGLHKLGPHPDDGKSPFELSPAQKDALLDREIGRRVWSAVTSQDWLCSTSQGMYTLQKRHYSSVLPRHFDEETMIPIQDDSTPTFTLISNFLNEISYILVRYLDDILDASDLPTKYNVVLRYDSIIRSLCIEKMPKFLSLSTPYNPAWPQWTMWARRSYHASSAHKIIMIHQSFLGKSFKDPRYTYSRWACISGSKTIIEAMNKRHPEEPQWWVEQAFVVTAGLCLGLDLVHRSEGDLEADDHQRLVERCVEILEQWPTSAVAGHGIRLLTSLLQEHSKKTCGSRRHSQQEENPAFPRNIAPQALADAASEATGPAEVTPSTSTDSTVPEGTTDIEPLWNADFDVDMSGFEDLMDNLPMAAGLDNNMFFESMLSLNNPSFI